MPSNYTENYQLSQWSRTDQVKMEDFNADNAKLDAALKAEADARTALAAEVAKRGNCSIGTFTYTGTGEYGSGHPTTITFPRRPTAYIIAGNGLLIGWGGGTRTSIVYSGHYGTGCPRIDTSWSGNTLSFLSSDSATGQMNELASVYIVIAFYAES